MFTGIKSIFNLESNNHINTLSIQDLYTLNKTLNITTNIQDSFILTTYFLNKNLVFSKNINKISLTTTKYLHNTIICVFFLKKLKTLNNINIFFKNSKIAFNTSNLFLYSGRSQKVLKKTLNNFYFYNNQLLSSLQKYQKIGFLNYKEGFLNLVNKNIFLSKQQSVVINNNSTVKFSSSSMVKYLSPSLFNSMEFQFLRKNKVYNKGRYSRCRQNYRTGVYMCMYLSIISIFGLYYWFYKFSFNFSYLWWFFFFFTSSFFLPKIVKYRLYEPTTLLNKTFGIIKWFFLLIKSFF